jgi:prepilin-type N-terminal cleavage/methylation domain-containing protein
MRRRVPSRGFTLVELAVAVAVAGIALTATAGAVTSGARLSRTSTETRAAVRSAESLMERIRATPYAQVVANFHDRTFPMSGVGGGDSSGVCRVLVTPLDTTSTRWTALQVVVTAQWRGTTGDTQQQFITFVSDRGDGSALSTGRVRIAADAGPP